MELFQMAYTRGIDFSLFSNCCEYDLGQFPFDYKQIKIAFGS